MSRMSLSNFVLPISYKQFRLLVAEFQYLAGTIFGGATTVQIRGMKSTKVSPTHMLEPGAMEYVGKVNARAIIFEHSELSQVTPAMFAAAKYIEVIVSPMNILVAPKYAFGHIEFKGERPRQTTLYLQPGDPKQFASLRSKHRFMLVGDGLDANSTP